MRTYYSPTFASRFGATTTDFDNLTQHLPPMMAGADHMIIDLTPLLVYGRFRLDGDAYHRLVTSENPGTIVLSRTLKMLHDYELLETFDARAFTELEQRYIKEQVQKAIGESFDLWLERSRNCITDWLNQEAEYRRSYSKELSVQRRVPFLIQGALAKMGQPLSVENFEHIRNLLFDDPDYSEEALTVQLCVIDAAASYVASNEVWRNRDENGPALDWDNLDLLSLWHDRNKFGRQMRQHKLSVARFAIEKYAGQNPLNIDTEKYVSFLRSKRIDDFRDYVDDVVSQCRDPSEELEKTAFELVRASNVQDRIRKWKIGIGAVVPAGGAAFELGFEIINGVAGDYQENLVDSYAESAAESSASAATGAPKPLRIKAAKAIEAFLS